MNKPINFLLFAVVSIHSLKCFAQKIPIVSGFVLDKTTSNNTLNIYGKNFNALSTGNVVYFGSAKAKIISASSTNINVFIPPAVTFQPIAVTDLSTNLTGYSEKPFMPTFSGSTIFTSKKDFISGIDPSNVQIGDLDGDGKLDIITTNRESNTISIFRNIYDVSKTIKFEDKKDLSTGNYPSAVSLGDLDGDGKLDLAVANFSDHTISTYHNASTIGNIVYNQKSNFTTGRLPTSLYIGDINGDGKSDIVTTNINDKAISIFLNTTNQSNSNSVESSKILNFKNEIERTVNSNIGRINFADKVDITLGNEPSQVKLADLNNDGKVEIIVSNFISNSISVLLNETADKNISFSQIDDLATGLSPLSISVGDFDQDEKTDLSASLVGGTVTVFRNISSENSLLFESKFDIQIGEFLSYSSSINTSDINGDKKPDLAIANAGSNLVTLLINNSEPGFISFEEKVEYSSIGNPFSVAIADLNGDLKPDLAFANADNNVLSILKQTCVPAVSISITNGINICDGAMVVFTSSSENGGLNPKYQWKKNGVDLEGENNSILIISTLKNDDEITLEMISNIATSCSENANVFSQPIKVIVKPSLVPKVSLMQISGSEKICEGTSISLNAIATNGGDSPIFIWKKNSQVINNETGATFSTDLLKNNDSISVTMISSSSCLFTSGVNSEVKVFIVSSNSSKPIIISDSLSICKNSMATLVGTCSVLTDNFKWVSDTLIDAKTISVFGNVAKRIISQPGLYTGFCASGTGCLNSERVSINIAENLICAKNNTLVVGGKGSNKNTIQNSNLAECLAICVPIKIVKFK